MSDEFEPRAGRPKPAARDVHVGIRLKQRRLALGMSQEALADAVGLTFQQIQKYENGINRVAASRLWELARALGVTVGFFYDEGTASRPGFADTQDGFDAAPALPDDARELLAAFARITDAEVRQRLLDLVKSLAPLPPPR
jgi:transcriptional regulator with XRE-family HTH domain